MEIGIEIDSRRLNERLFPTNPNARSDFMIWMWTIVSDTSHDIVEPYASSRERPEKHFTYALRQTPFVRRNRLGIVWL